MRIDWSELEDAFDFANPEFEVFLDRETGQIVQAFDGSAEELEDLDLDSSRYARIEPPLSGEQWNWMSAFVETVKDEHFADLLDVAIQGRGAFRRFKDVLDRKPAERDRWYAFQKERMREAIRWWLCENEIEADDPPDWARPPAEED